MRHGDEVWSYSTSLHGVGMLKLSEQYAHARALVADGSARDLRRGFTYTFLLLTGTIWIVAFLALVYVAHRISRPIQQLTGGLVASSRGASGLPGPQRPRRRNWRRHSGLQRHGQPARGSHERLLYTARLESWQALARKMAHEVKNSLTPSACTMEEIAARQSGAGWRILRTGRTDRRR